MSERDLALRGLLEGHRRDLAQARRLGRAASGGEGGLASVARSILAFWRRETSTYFRKEEEVLLPVLARHGGDLEGGHATRMLAQHARIRGLVMQLSDEEGRSEVRPETLRSLGERLEEHVRLEEQEVFPLVEGTIPERALEEVASRLEAFEAGSRAESWVPARGLSFAPYPGPGDSEGGG